MKIYKKVRIESIKEKANSLNIREKQELIAYLKSSYSIFDEHAKVEACPVCASTHIVKNGTRGGHHKYICRDCKKNFTYRTNTILSGIQKLNKWNMFVEDFMSLNITSIKYLKTQLGVSEQTIFNWRHKLLSALVNKEPRFKNEVVEFDETNLLISRKGRQDMNIGNKHAYMYWRRKQSGESDYTTKIFVSYGRTSKKLELYLSNMGRTTRTDLKNYFIKSKFKNTTIYSDKHPTYLGFFDDNKIKHESFRAEYHRDFVNKKVHNQTINRYISDFKGFVNTYLRGVSTKYLSDYLKWFMFIHEAKVAVNKQIALNRKIKFNIVDSICDKVVKDNIGLGLYRQMEYSYETFLKQNGRTDFGTCKNHYYNDNVAC